MNDTTREYLSYGKLFLPLLKCKKIISFQEHRWGNKDQYFLHFTSPSKKSDTLVIYIHGGGWNSNSPKQHYFIGQKVALEGYDCIMPGYRKTPKFGYEEISDDIFHGYAEIKKYLLEKKFSYSKIVVMGSSAGAHLGALLCFDEEKKKQYNISSDEFSGLISLAGPVSFEFSRTPAQDTLLSYLFKSKNPADWKKGEPYSKMTSLKNFKLFAVQSEHDGIVCMDQAKEFCKKAESLKIPAKLYEVTDDWNTHTLYCAGIFLLNRHDSNTLETVFRFIEEV